MGTRLARPRGGRAERRLHSLPAVDVVDRLSHIPLFGFVSVDELFRITSLGLESRHPEGHALHVAGASVEHVECLIEGAVQATDAEGRSSDHRAPSVFGLEEALQGAPTLRTVLATEPVVSFRIRAADFMTMISDNVWLAQGLFRMLLAGRDRRRSPAFTSPVPCRVEGAASRNAAARGPGVPFVPSTRCWARNGQPAAGDRWRGTRGAAREGTGPLRGGYRGRPAPRARWRPAAAGGDGTVVPVASGTTIDVAETLAGAPTRLARHRDREWIGSRLGRDELFAVLTDHVDLMQALFSGALALRASAVAPVPVA